MFCSPQQNILISPLLKPHQQNSSFQTLPNEARISLTLPIRSGGFGLRSTVRTSPAAYWSALAQAAPELLADAKAVIATSPSINPATTSGATDTKTSTSAATTKTTATSAPAIPECLTNGSKDFAVTLYDCHKSMKKSGINPLEDDLLPLSPSGFWELYGKKSPGSGLQRLLVSEIESNLAADLMIQADKDNMAKARLRSIKGKKAGAWLSTLPTTPALTLSDLHFRVASRLRLGLPPQDQLPATCKCGANLRADPHHFLSCKYIKRAAATHRHTMILQKLSFVLQKAGAAVHIDPNWFEGKRPDAQVNCAHENVMIDVSVTHPSSPSLCQGAAGKHLSEAGIREKQKIAKYDRLAKIGGVSLCSLCVGVVWLIWEPSNQICP